MDYLPLFLDLTNRRVLVVGGGDVAARKIALLRCAGADVSVVAKNLCEELQRLYDEGLLAWPDVTFDERHLDGIFLVIAATDDCALNARVFHAADNRRIFVNVVDDQQRCSFIFPSIVDRSPVMIAISSAGKAPVLARMLREKLEALIPSSVGVMAKVAGEWREKVKQRLPSVSSRRRFWERLFNGYFASLISAGNIQQAESHLSQELEKKQPDQGHVTLVGAGPGDAGLLTLKGLQAIQQADVVLYDHLVSDEVMELIRRDAERICVGKRAGNHSVMQEETNRLLVTLAREGKRVVRLKGGDPFIFGRGGEELEVLVEAGITYQVVPGVTAAAGASAYAGIPLTHREHAQSVLFITGHCNTENEVPDWAALARARQTLAIYMGTVKAAEIRQQLIQNGREADTPVAVISRGTRRDQRVFTGTLAQLDTLAQQAPTPALLVVGEVAALHQQLAWFNQSSTSVHEEAVIHEAAIRPAVVNLA